MHKGILVVIGAFAFPVFASQPGQPLDCSDWVFLEPGISCAPLLTFGTADPTSAPLRKGSQRESDNNGALYSLRTVPFNCSEALPYTWESCPRRLELVRLDPQGEHLVAYVNDRVGNPSSNLDHIRPTGSYCASADTGIPPCPSYAGIELNDALSFDPVQGRFLISVRSYCKTGQSSCSEGAYDGWWIAAIMGFTPLFEILQTYTPTADALQFRVPAHPEGLRSADHFDTYWGRVGDLPDFTQAHPMACHYPASPPAAGAYLTVVDTSPRPSAGLANYTVTAVTSGTHRRYGRKRIGGVMSGRDPALLPGCP